MAALNEEQMKFVNELEMEMMADMYNRMSASCLTKCIPPKSNDSEISKVEAVCQDRCVAKYLEMYDRIGRRLTEKSQEQEKQMQAIMEQQKAAV